MKKIRASILSIIILAVLSGLLSAPAFAQQERPLYLNPEAPIHERVEDLLSRMTLEEKIGQMSQLDISQINTTGIQADVVLDPEKARNLIVNHHVGSFINGEAVPPQQWYEYMAGLTRIAVEESRLGIPIIYGIDHVHGASYMAETTIFPQPINLGATFNTAHSYNMGWVTALEMADVGHHWNFAPTLDVGVNQIWGRLYETFGEDPLLVSQMGVAYLDGFHNNADIAPYRLASNAKHFIAYSDPVSGWDKTPVSMSMQEICEIHLPPFQAAIDAGLMTIMGNSAEVNGEPVHASHFFLTEMLRNQLGFEGVVLTDWDEVGKLVGFHRTARDYKEATYQAVTAGIDVSMTPLTLQFNDALLELVQEGRISEERIDESVRRVLRLKFEIGLFENPFPRSDRLARIGSEESRLKSLEAARESIVLLKNEDEVLPLQNPARIVLAGPSANSKRNLAGGWTLAWQGGREEQYPERMHTIYSALQAAFPDAQVELMEALPENREQLMGQLAGADVIIYAGGEEPYAEFLGNITDLNLPQEQKDDIRHLAASGIPMVTVLVQGRPRLITDVLGHMDALIHAGLPGFEGAEAIADVLSGRVNPSGRLPFTYPAFSGHMLNYNHKPSDIFFFHPDSQHPFEEPNPGTHLFTFGEGLSYTSFSYSDLRVSADEVSAGGSLTASVTVTNTGDVAGSRPLLWFLSNTYATIPRPVRELKHFERVHLEPGASQTLEFEIRPEEVLWYPDGNCERVFEAGTFLVRVGTLKESFEFRP
ncbi:MAG: glycoside hydrolase family 3 C-terminal domain-containing protein [Candidatus Cyclonatronum sp.]|uniref:glycoside hydrolase family 3 N-terminal domain-containing protein n=1 Tax=Cyclonatronum sp. TaxID=3024185 RepID=UPI0025C47346|nr:glycoside hydrolase family 3 N-terminal domain-containing protein [Cyclonatronum sp.]MCH8487135.1 glycoside hydrolase family 3 C-terminal domain-containing protein [Cyclonatronum sp.]